MNVHMKYYPWNEKLHNLTTIETLLLWMALANHIERAYVTEKVLLTHAKI